MPFTAAHPALILPLLRLKSRWLSTTGLIVGSIAPDFAYFLPYRSYGSLSHSFKGLLVFDLPMAIVLAIVFHVFVREQAVNNLPEYFRERALAVKPVKIGRYLLKNWLIFAVSALIGSFTHLFWDSFTHANEYFVRNYSFLLTPVSLGFIELPLSRVIQHTSTFVGLAAIGWYLTTLPTIEIKNSNWFSWMPYWIFIGFMGAVFMLLNLPRSLGISDLEKLVIPFLTGNLFAGILLGVLYKLNALFRTTRN
ncbi:DUF4184 family protein [Pontibacter sp. BT310]|uniref:DUF4184 family protein n=1 Tax=Pontibacter populi TaxID=890055 RepID=A0ABS6X778_9BACT|nr:MULTISPECIES: DUF4184 family protein [Pontibacter]MBJ6117001.1 DUF4184 family protein [Pontibacter sp. BT310]MBR0569425.1 DUF4184 family protein [Microvirga sp. STS03]MBW3363854.1 DUF4184 family protein [Pontibacter populi]